MYKYIFLILLDFWNCLEHFNLFKINVLNFFTEDIVELFIFNGKNSKLRD